MQNSRVMLQEMPSFCRISHALMPSQVLAILMRTRDLSMPVQFFQHTQRQAGRRGGSAEMGNKGVARAQ